MSDRYDGTALVNDLPALLAAYRGFSLAQAKEFVQKVKDSNPFRQPCKSDPIGAAVTKMFVVTSWCSHPPSEKEEAKWPVQREKEAQSMERFIRFAEDFNQPLQVKVWVDGLFAFLHMGNPEAGIIIPYPERYLSYCPPVDYSDMTAADVRKALNTPQSSALKSLLPAKVEASMTRAALDVSLSEKSTEKSQLLQKMDDVKHARTAELAAAQAEIDTLQKKLNSKKATLMAELNEKMAAMEAEMERIEGQIYLLDSQIYAIRCFAGEVVKFAQVRTGRNAPNTEPVVIHQKLRFLDEDLGRLASLYEIQWDDISMFEEFLRHSPLALDTFAPNDRCVVLVRLSRSGKQTGENSSLPYSNMIKQYKYYHGKTVGIIIRNGGNLYIGWTDEQRVKIEDDLIISQMVTAVEPNQPTGIQTAFSEEQEKKEQKMKVKTLLDGIISRTFVYNILQGIVEHSSLLPLPAGTTLAKQSEYVIYAIADKWLTDNRFGSFTEIVERCNIRVQLNDTILTVQRLVAERPYSYHSGFMPRTWENIRGRGARNRTHDVEAADCTLYPVNLVEYDPPVDMIRYRMQIPDEYTSGIKMVWREFTKAKREFDKLFGDKRNQNGALDIDAGEPDLNCQTSIEVLEEYQTENRHVYISLKKKDSWNPSRANFEVYSSEFINLTYMNSVWLEWVITNKTLGNWRVGGIAVEYSYAIRYLKTAMDYVRAREEKEKAAIDAVDINVCEDPNWPLRLSEWKLEVGVREITSYQAKRFVKAYNTADKST